KRGLAQPGRPGEQHMVERLASPLGCLDEDRQLIGHLHLVDEIGQAWRTEGAIEIFVRDVGARVVYADLRLLVDARGADSLLAHAAFLPAPALRSAVASSSPASPPLIPSSSCSASSGA